MDGLAARHSRVLQPAHAMLPAAASNTPLCHAMTTVVRTPSPATVRISKNKLGRAFLVAFHL
jgi:hypothetical protein